MLSLIRRNFHTSEEATMSSPLQLSRGHVVDSAGVGQVLLLERPLICPAVIHQQPLNPLKPSSLLSLTLTEGHTLPSCHALSLGLLLRLPSSLSSLSLHLYVYLYVTMDECLCFQNPSERLEVRWVSASYVAMSP